MKKIMLIAAIAAALCLTACGNAENGDTTENAASQATEAETDQAAETEPAPENEPADETETEPTEETEQADETESEASEEPAEEAEPEIFTPVEGLSEDYVDFENRRFAYDGTVLTLGESTLQDLVDAGVPFDEDELKNIDNNVNSNFETARYTVKINYYTTMQFIFMNDTDESKTEGECLLSTVRWYTLDVPQPDFDENRNKDIIADIKDSATHVCFSFPLTLTRDQLLEQNSDTTKINEDLGQVVYKVDSEVYFGSSGYVFSFNKNTDQLKEVNITWLP